MRDSQEAAIPKVANKYCILQYFSQCVILED